MIVGLIVLVGLILYLILTLVLVIANARSARKEGKSGWVRGSVVLVFMYLLLFWDWIPVHVVIQHDCASEGGFTVNKTLNQWKAEKSGVAETLVPYKNVTSEKSGERRVINRTNVLPGISGQRMTSWESRSVMSAL